MSEGSQASITPIALRRTEINNRAQKVAAELKLIFEAEGELPRAKFSAETLTRPSAVVSFGGGKRPPWRALAAVAVFILIGGVVGVQVRRDDKLDLMQPHPNRAMSIVVSHDNPIATLDPTNRMKVVAETTIVESPSRTPQLVQTSAGLGPSTPVERALGTEKPGGVAVEGKAPPRADEYAEEQCGSLSPLAPPACLYPALIRAEGELRDAYRKASDAGVPSSIMADYRRDWDEQRTFAWRDPYMVLNNYEAMADELNGYASEADSAG